MHANTKKRTVMLRGGILVINPTEQYTEPCDVLFETMGVLPHWIDVHNPNSFKKQLTDAYQFPIAWQKANIDQTLVYHYPDDPPLHPIGIMERMAPKQEVVIFYPYGMVGIINLNGPEKHALSGRLD